MINIHIAFLGYMLIQCAVFGLLLGIAAENVKGIRHSAFLWLLAFCWPLILAWKLLCKREVTP